MTNFTKETLTVSNENIMFFNGERCQTVARFKYARGSRTTFVNFLIKNFTVEEYFARMNAGEAPLTIAESKGFMLSHVKKLLKEMGYEVSLAGRAKYIADRVAQYSKV
jgi:hypothetical protein